MTHLFCLGTEIAVTENQEGAVLPQEMMTLHCLVSMYIFHIDCPGSFNHSMQTFSHAPLRTVVAETIC